MASSLDDPIDPTSEISNQLGMGSRLYAVIPSTTITKCAE